jgi:ribosomal protein L11 methylase PrmA
VAVEVAEADVTRAAPWAPTVVANLTLPLLQAARAERPRRLIASGVLAEQADAVAPAFGMAERERRHEDGWVALLLEAA